MINDDETPDFSGDDLADNKSVQEIRAARKAYEDMIEAATEVLRTQLNIKEGNDDKLDHFAMFKNIEAYVVASLHSVSQPNAFSVSLINYSSSVNTARQSYSVEDDYLFGRIRTKHTYPRTYIHKETIKEKLLDLFLKQDLDFDHSKLFSKTFQVLTEDKGKLLELFQFMELDPLANFREMEIELSGNECLFRHSRKPVSPEEAQNFCNLAKALLAIFQ